MIDQSKTMYISSGATNGMYTLRKVTVYAHGTQVFTRNACLCNLGCDWEEVYAKFLRAVEDAEKEHGIPVKIGTDRDGQWELNEWGTGGTGKDRFSHSDYMSWKATIEAGAMPFGKWSGFPLKDVPASYRNWVRGVCFDMAGNRNKAKSRAYEILFDALEPFASEDSVVAEEEELAKAAKALAHVQKRAQSSHVGVIGERVTETVTCESRIPWQNSFGDGIIKVLRTDKGDVIKVFSKLEISVGEKAKITGKVKSHGDWKGQKETVLTHIKKEKA